MAHQLRADGATDAEVRLYITFTSALDRARDADLLWRRSARLFSKIRWPFAPEECVSRPIGELKDSLRQSGVSQRHGPDSSGWRRIAQTLSKPALAPEAHAAVFEGRGDAGALLMELENLQEGRALFPFLRGPKVGPMWVRMLAYPGGAAMTSLETLPVAVDVQVRKVTEYLGVTDTLGDNLEKVRGLVQARWAEDVRVNGAEGPSSLTDTCAALDPALWFYAKWGCTWCERSGRKVPISAICDICRFGELHGSRHRTLGHTLLERF